MEDVSDEAAPYRATWSAALANFPLRSSRHIPTPPNVPLIVLADRRPSFLELCESSLQHYCEWWCSAD